MKLENENVDKPHKGLGRRDFLVMLASCTASLMLPGCAQSEVKITTAPTTAPTTASTAAPTKAPTKAPSIAPTAATTAAPATASGSDRLGALLPLRKLGSSNAAVTNLGVGGAHVGTVSEKDAQAIIEKALEEGVRFFDNAPFYSGGIAEERYGMFLTPKYRDVSFLMTKSMARNKEAALKDLDASLTRMKTDYVDLWQLHSLESPQDVEDRIKNGVLDAFLEAQKLGKARYLGFTGHSDYKAHLKMLEEIQKRRFKINSSQMPVNPADPHYQSFIIHVLPKCVEIGIGVLAMKTLADGRFFGGNRGWGRTHVSVKPVVPDVLTVESVFGFVWSLPITTLVSGMESVQQVSQNAAIARKTWTWDQAERQKYIDAVAPFAGPDLEFYKN